MSTVMYCYRIKRTNWWDFHAILMKFYREKSTIARAFKAAKDYDTMRRLLDTAKMFGEEKVDLQLFEETEGTYLFRVLESGYFFMNNYQEQGWPIEPVFYDNRTDIEPHEEGNAEIADWLDEQITAHRYFIAPVLDEQTLTRLWMDRGIE